MDNPLFGVIGLLLVFGLLASGCCGGTAGSAAASSSSEVGCQELLADDYPHVAKNSFIPSVKMYLANGITQMNFDEPYITAYGCEYGADVGQTPEHIYCDPVKVKRVSVSSDGTIQGITCYQIHLVELEEIGPRENDIFSYNLRILDMKCREIGC